MTDLRHRIAWAIRVEEVKEDGAQRSLDFYNSQAQSKRVNTGWYLALRKADAVIAALQEVQHDPR